MRRVISIRRRRYAWVVGCLLLGTSVAVGQAHNWGKYHTIHREGDIAIYKLVQSEYVPGIENEPYQPGDFKVSSQSAGDWCEPTTEECYKLKTGEADSGGMSRMIARRIEGKAPKTIVVWRED